MTNKHVLILTALNLEYLAIRNRMTNIRPELHRWGTRFEVGQFADGTQVALTLVDKGNQNAAALTTRAIEQFDPALAIFVGVAGAAQSGVALGDIVVATHVYGYHGATSEDGGAKSRPRTWGISHREDQLARHIDRTDEWRRFLPDGAEKPTIHFGPIAAGEVVINSRKSSHAQWIDEHYNDTKAIEMESAGAAQAAHLSDNKPIVVVRGISDRADGTKEKTDGENWQPRAVANAAAFAEALACARMARSVSDAAGEKDPAHPENQKSTPNVRQRATNSNHFVQAGTISGGVSFVSGPERQPHRDLPISEQIAVLRARLAEASGSGDLDAETAAAAQLDLSAAEAAINGGSGTNPSVALKRLRGLVDEVPDLLAQVNTVILTLGSRS